MTIDKVKMQLEKFKMHNLMFAALLGQRECLDNKLGRAAWG